MAVVTARYLLLELKFWSEMRTKEKKTKTTAKQQQNHKQKQTPQHNNNKKHHKIWQHKSGANILIKVIRLMEVTGWHAQINILLKTKFITTGASVLVFWSVNINWGLRVDKYKLRAEADKSKLRARGFYIQIGAWNAKNKLGPGSRDRKHKYPIFQSTVSYYFNGTPKD